MYERWNVIYFQVCDIKLPDWSPNKSKYISKIFKQQILRMMVWIQIGQSEKSNTKKKETTYMVLSMGKN